MRNGDGAALTAVILWLMFAVGPWWLGVLIWIGWYALNVQDTSA